MATKANTAPARGKRANQTKPYADQGEYHAVTDDEFDNIGGARPSAMRMPIS